MIIFLSTICRTYSDLVDLAVILGRKLSTVLAWSASGHLFVVVPFLFSTAVNLVSCSLLEDRSTVFEAHHMNGTSVTTRRLMSLKFE